jgi:hypothetical protein
MDWRWGSSDKESDYKHEALSSNSSLTKKKGSVGEWSRMWWKACFHVVVGK